MVKPKFAYLLLKEHPYGREMLRQILSEGFVPSLIVPPICVFDISGMKTIAA